MLRFLRWSPALLLLVGCGDSGDVPSDDAVADSPWLQDALPPSDAPASPPAAPGSTIVAGGSATVSMHLTLTVDGEVLQTTAGGNPFTYTQGKQQAMTGLEQAVVGMSLGEKKKIVLSPAQAFGEPDTTAVREVPRQVFPETTEFVVGEDVQGEIQGRPFRATVLALDEERVTLDMNHPLAGKTLNFDVEIVSIR